MSSDPDIFVRAAAEGNLEAVKNFLTAGTDPDLRDKQDKRGQVFILITGQKGSGLHS